MQLMKGINKFNDPGATGIKMGHSDSRERTSENKNVSFYNEYGQHIHGHFGVGENGENVFILHQVMKPDESY